MRYSSTSASPASAQRMALFPTQSRLPEGCLSSGPTRRAPTTAMSFCPKGGSSSTALQAEDPLWRPTPCRSSATATSLTWTVASRPGTPAVGRSLAAVRDARDSRACRARPQSPSVADVIPSCSPSRWTRSASGSQWVGPTRGALYSARGCRLQSRFCRDRVRPPARGHASSPKRDYPLPASP